MARIDTYNLDDNVTGSDKWIGTDGNDARKTKNFSPTYLANYLNQNEVIDVSNSIRFTYDTIDSGKSRKSGTLSFATEIGAIVPINSLTTFILSKNTQGTKLVNAFLNILPNTKIILQKSDYVNIFGIFKVISVTQIELEPDFYTVVVEYISGYGNLEEDKDYLISIIDLQGASGDIPTKTSDLINDGEDGVHSFITIEDLPPSASTLQEVLDNGNESTTQAKFKNVSGEFGDYNSENDISSLGSSIVLSSTNPLDPYYSSIYAPYETSLNTHVGDITNNISIYENKIEAAYTDSENNSSANLIAAQNGGQLNLKNSSATVQIGSTNISQNIILESPNKTAGTYTIATTEDILNNSTLHQVLIAGNETLGHNIKVNDADAVELENGSLLKKGNYDFGGAGGISRICSIGYEDMWQSGIRHVFDNNGFIRNSTNCFSIIPDNTFDDVLRFKIGSLWTLDNGDTYECLDATTGAAVWELKTLGNQNLQQVTDNGNSTTNDIISNDGAYKGTLSPYEVNIQNGSTTDTSALQYDRIIRLFDGGLGIRIQNLIFENPTIDGTITIPNGTGVLALTSDIPSPTAILTTTITDGDTTHAPDGNSVFDALATKEPIITAGTTSQYWRGDKTWQTLPTAGTGDMTKAVYDVDNTGVVDNAEAISIIGRNSTGSTLYKGTIVYISFSTGNRPNFVKARANSEATSAGTFGVIKEDILNNADGYCTTLGYLDNLDTRTTATNPFTSDTLADGDTIYLSPTTAGYITNVKPSAPNHLVYIGKVTRTSPTNGTIVYRIANGFELEELHNVAIATPTNEDFLQYESSTSLWKNIQLTAAWLKAKIGNASASVSGILSSTDWNTFNNKQNAIGYTPADDSNVVHKTGTETIGGLKTFSSNPTIPANGGNVGQGAVVVDNGSGVLQVAYNGVYPNLSELATVKGVTSAIQPQIDAVNVNVITITTSVSITTDTTNGTYGQHGRHNKISNGANAINIQCVSTSNADFVASYEKIGTGAITFTFTAPITNVVQLSGTNQITAAAAVGSKACLSRNGNIYYLQITNY